MEWNGRSVYCRGSAICSQANNREDHSSFSQSGNRLISSIRQNLSTLGSSFPPGHPRRCELVQRRETCQRTERLRELGFCLLEEINLFPNWVKLLWSPLLFAWLQTSEHLQHTLLPLHSITYFFLSTPSHTSSSPLQHKLLSLHSITQNN